MKVLVVEDFEVLARSIGTGLRRAGMAVDVVLDGTDALGYLAAARYDVVVLDRDLPGVSGDDICRRLAGDRAGTRVLMLTAAGTIGDRVEGLSLGADDYLPKPFAFAELVARVRALSRRSAPPLPPVLTCGDISLDPARHAAFRAGRRLELSPKEFALLECLLAAPGLVLSAEDVRRHPGDLAPRGPGPRSRQRLPPHVLKHAFEHVRQDARLRIRAGQGVLVCAFGPTGSSCGASGGRARHGTPTAVPASSPTTVPSGVFSNVV